MLQAARARSSVAAMALGVLTVLVTSGAADAANTASLPAKQIVKNAVNASSNASSVTITGLLRQGSQTVVLNLITAHGSGKGYISIGGQRLDIVKIGPKTYLRGGAAFWKSAAGSASAANLLANRWVTQNSIGADFDSFLDVHQLLTTNGSVESGVLTKAGTGTVNGQAAIIIHGHQPGDPSNGGRLYVAAHGAPYVLRISGSGGGNAGQITFSNYNQPVHLSKPPNVLDFGDLGNSG